MSDVGVAAAAVEAAVAADALARVLAEVAHDLGRAAAIATPDWAGPHRDGFDERVAALQSVCVDGAAALRVLRRRLLEWVASS